MEYRKDWLDKSIQPRTGIDGAGGIRQVGRFMLFQKADDLYQKLQETIKTLRQGYNNNTEMNVFIFSGISGGTGAGIFLEVNLHLYQ